MLTQGLILRSNPQNSYVNSETSVHQLITNSRCYHLKLGDEARLEGTLVLFPEYSPKTRLALPQTYLKFISTKMLYFYIPVSFTAEKPGAGMSEEESYKWQQSHERPLKKYVHSAKM